jgi:hypothetical protein
MVFILLVDKQQILVLLHDGKEIVNGPKRDGCKLNPTKSAYLLLVSQ